MKELHYRSNRRHIESEAKLFCAMKESLPDGCKSAYAEAYWDSDRNDTRFTDDAIIHYEGSYCIVVRDGYIFGSSECRSEYCVNVSEIREACATVKKVR